MCPVECDIQWRVLEVAYVEFGRNSKEALRERSHKLEGETSYVGISTCFLKKILSDRKKISLYMGFGTYVVTRNWFVKVRYNPKRELYIKHKEHLCSCIIMWLFRDSLASYPRTGLIFGHFGKPLTEANVC